MNSEGEMSQKFDVKGLSDEERDLVRDFVVFLRSRHEAKLAERRLERDWGFLAESGFTYDWDNDLDAIYDDWKIRYHVKTG